MSFTGKATYSGGPGLPEIAEDVSDIISIVSPYETPLLDHLGDPTRAATSTMHEWLEDTLLPNQDKIDDTLITSPESQESFNVVNGDRFRVGDQIMMKNAEEIMLVTNITGETLAVQRNYGGTPTTNLEHDATLLIIGNAALEGAGKPETRFTVRQRLQNYTQIFTAGLEVSGSQLAVNTIGVADELDYQKQERLRELLRDLENSVINGIDPGDDPEGSGTTRRTMRGIRAWIESNIFSPGVDDMPEGDDGALNEELLNAALRAIWEQSSGSIDTIVCGGFQKRKINQFIASGQRFVEKDAHYQSMVDVYESDFGVCRVVMSRWVPQDALLLLDSSRIDIMPLAGRSFHYKPLASTGDSECGQIIGEYTMELRNENAHGLITGLDV